MANYNPVINENPRIAEAGKATQFQPGNREQLKGKPWSVRNSMRKHAGIEGELPSMEARKRMTPAQRIALKMLEKAEEGGERAAEIVIDNIDGKVVQPNLNADLARLQDMTDGQLHDELKRIEDELNSFADSSEDGNVTEGAGSADSD